MSVYHSIRSSLQHADEDDDIEEQDDMVLVNMTPEAVPETVIHPALDRNSGHVSFFFAI